MANADFSQNQNPNPGGFDAGSYREAAPKTETVRLTPAQQKLAGLEAALPAALRTQGAALVLSVVVMLAAFFGFGGAKLKAKANEAAKWYTVSVSADGGYTLSEELTTRANTAANILTTGGNTLGADNAEVLAAQDALSVFNNADPMKMGAVQGQYGQFNSAATIIGNLTYNEKVYDYQKGTGGFPASVLKSLFGVKEVEPFA